MIGEFIIYEQLDEAEYAIVFQALIQWLKGPILFKTDTARLILQKFSIIAMLTLVVLVDPWENFLYISLYRKQPFFCFFALEHNNSANQQS